MSAGDDDWVMNEQRLKLEVGHLRGERSWVGVDFTSCVLFDVKQAALCCLSACVSLLSDVHR